MIKWFEGSVEQAFTAARVQNKLLLIYWGSEWCPYSQALRAAIFIREDVGEKTDCFVPVYLDGDQIGAQKWGQALNLSGYPAVAVLRPDRQEIARMAGGTDPSRYSLLLDDVLQDPRPINEVLADAESAVACRRLAFHDWDAADHRGNALDFAHRLTAAALRCSGDERARLETHALAFTIESAEGGSNLDKRIRMLADLLGDRARARAVIDLLLQRDSRIFEIVESFGVMFAGSFVEAWSAAMFDAARDARFGAAERLAAISSALDATRALSADHAIPGEMERAARACTAEALAADHDSHERDGIINAAKGVYATLHDDTAAYDLLERELSNSRTPYFHMSGLAFLDEKNDRRAQAIDWMIRACTAAAAAGPATRVQWGESCVSGLIRLTPDDVPMIRATALRVANELDGVDAQHGRTRVRIDRMSAALGKWADAPERRAALGEVAASLARMR